MRVEHCVTGMWVVFAGAFFWIVGFVLYFLLASTIPEWWTYTGLALMIAGMFLIIAGGQIIRVATKGESLQPTEEGGKMRIIVCPSCGADNPDDARHCLGCGKKLRKSFARSRDVAGGSGA